MSQVSASLASVTSPSGKRKLSSVDGASSVNPSPKFSKSNTNKVVPTVVAVDMGSPPSKTQSSVPASAPAGAPKERSIATRLDWRLINNRESLERVLRVNKMSFKPTKGGVSYISVDVAAYKEITGIQVQLDEHGHFKTRGPFMLNIWGISSQLINGGVNHSVAFDIKDSSRDVEAQEFAKFAALMDDVILEKCVGLAINTKEIRDSVQWVDFCKNDETGEINLKKLREVVAKNFQGALRCSKTARSKPEFQPVKFDAQSGAPIISDDFFFKSKIRGKRHNSNLMDLSCFTPDGQPVFYGSVKELEHERATYLQTDFEVPSINWVGKTFYSTWVARKITYQIKGGVGEAEEKQTDMDGNVISQEKLDELARQEQEYLAKKSDPTIPDQMVVNGDDGGFGDAAQELQ